MDPVKALPVRIGETDVLIEVTPIAGSEPTAAKPGELADRALDALARAQVAIIDIAKQTAGSVNDLLTQARHPNEVKVEFGIALTAQGNVLIAGGSAQATLKVTLTYDLREG
jgi:Trypsin-co-occurring domain 1